MTKSDKICLDHIFPDENKDIYIFFFCIVTLFSIQLNTFKYHYNESKIIIHSVLELRINR